jgi:hypothetical protein
MQTVYHANMLHAFAGMRCALGDTYMARTYVNDKGSTRKTVDVVPAVVNSHYYEFLVAGIPVYYQAGGSTTAALIRDGLLAHARSLLELEKLATFNPNSTNVRVRARQQGYDLSITESNAQLSLSTVVAHEASQAIPFGSAIVRRSGGSDKSCMLPTTPTAKVVRISVDAATNSKVYDFWLSIDLWGDVLVSITADGSATQAEIATAIAARVNAMPIPITAAVASSTYVDLTADVPGADFSIYELDDELSYTVTTANAKNQLLGVLERTPSSVDTFNADANNLGEAAPYHDLTVVSKGPMWVPVEQAVTPADPVYFRHTTGSGGTVLGRWRKDGDSGTADLVPSAAWRSSRDNGLAMVELNLP